MAETGVALDLRRPEPPPGAADTASFERLAVASAADAVRRRGTHGMPLHVAVSSALLDGRVEFGSVIDLFHRNPATARSLILTLPHDVLGGRHHRTLQRLAAAEVALSVEGWERSPSELAEQRSVNLRFLRLSAGWLLERARGADIDALVTVLDAAAAAGVEIIATEIGNDEDAVEILDLGIDLMTGPHFSGPKLLKSEGAPLPHRLAGS